jgi:hypothetical protein
MALSRVIKRGGRRLAGVTAAFALAIACAGLAAGIASADTAVPTVTLTVVPTNPDAPTDQVTLTAVASGIPADQGGSIQFLDANAAVSPLYRQSFGAPGTTTVTATYVTTFPTGAHTLTARYASANLAVVATSNPVSLTVGSIPPLSRTTVTLTVPPGPIVQGQHVTLTALVSRVGGGIPTGFVAFTDNGVPLDIGGESQRVPLVNGVATYEASGFPGGTHAFQASYLGNSTDKPSSSPITSVDVQPQSQAVDTTTTVTVAPVRIVAGQLVTITAHVVQSGPGHLAPPNGSFVTFTANGQPIGTQPLVNGTATLENVGGWIDAGDHVVGALYVGDVADGFNISRGQTSLAVLAHAQPLTITAPSASIVYGTPTPALNPTYSNTFLPGDGPSALDVQPTCTTAPPGVTARTYSVECTGAASTVYDITNVPGTLTIAPAPLTVTANSFTIAPGQPMPVLTATITGFKNSETLATSGVLGTAACTTTITSTATAGTFPITCALGSLNATNYTFATFNGGTLTIIPPVPPMVCVRPADEKPSANRGKGSACEELLSHPTAGSGGKVAGGDTMSIVYADDTPMDRSLLFGPSVVMLNGPTLLPVTVTSSTQGKSRYQSIISFSVPTGLAPGTYSILVTVHDNDGHLDQWMWDVKIDKASKNDKNDKGDK